MILIDAVRNGDIELVQELLENGANPNIQNRNGRTALMVAIAWGYTDIVLLLLEKGADPNISANSGERLPNTALEVAEFYGAHDIIKILEAYISLYQRWDKEDDPPDEPDRDLQKYESARDIQRRFRGNRQRRQLTKKAHRYGKMYGPATRKETMRRWVDLSKQFDGDDVLGYLASTTYPFSKKGGKKKRRKTKKKKRKKSKKKSKKKTKP